VESRESAISIHNDDARADVDIHTCALGVPVLIDTLADAEANAR
jgi:hypothetical protein